MKTKAFDNENFEATGLNLNLQSLTDNDPKVNKVTLETDSENVPEITHNPKKEKKEKAAKKDPITGINFEDSETSKQVQKNLSEIPDKLKKIRAALNDGRTVNVTCDITRWESDSGTGFFLSDSQVEGMELDIEEAVSDEDLSSDDVDEDNLL